MLWQKCLLLGSLAAVGCCQSSECYFPSGLRARTYEPCDESAFTSLCCPYGWTCYSGKVCVVSRSDTVDSEVPLGTVSRGACSSKEWEEGACGEFCLDSGRNGRLTSCGENRYCCTSDESKGLCDCESGEGTFYKEFGTPEIIIGLPDVDPTPLPTSRKLTSTRTRPPASTRTPSKTSSTSSASTTDSPEVTESGNSPTDPPSPSDTTSAISEGKSQDGGVTRSTAFKAGVAVGASAAGIIIALILFLCVRSYRRKNRDEDGDSIESAGPHSNEPRKSMDFREQEAMLSFQDRSDYSISPHPQRSQPRSGAIRWTSAPGQGWQGGTSNGRAPNSMIAPVAIPKKSRNNQRGRKSYPQQKYSMLHPVAEVFEPPSKPNSPIPFDNDDEFPSPVSPISPPVNINYSVPRRPLPSSAYQPLGLPRASI